MENIKAKKINEVFNKYGSTLNLHEIKSITGAGNGYKHTTIHSDNNIVNAVANNSNKFEKIYNAITNIKGKGAEEHEKTNPTIHCSSASRNA